MRRSQEGCINHTPLFMHDCILFACRTSHSPGTSAMAPAARPLCAGSARSRHARTPPIWCSTRKDAHSFGDLIAHRLTLAGKVDRPAATQPHDLFYCCCKCAICYDLQAPRVRLPCRQLRALGASHQHTLCQAPPPQALPSKHKRAASSSWQPAAVSTRCRRLWGGRG